MITGANSAATAATRIIASPERAIRFRIRHIASMTSKGQRAGDHNPVQDVGVQRSGEPGWRDGRSDHECARTCLDYRQNPPVMVSCPR